MVDYTARISHQILLSEDSRVRREGERIGRYKRKKLIEPEIFISDYFCSFIFFDALPGRFHKC